MSIEIKQLVSELKRAHMQLGRVHTNRETNNHEIERVSLENEKTTKKLVKLLTENDLAKKKIDELQKELADKVSNANSKQNKSKSIFGW